MLRFLFGFSSPWQNSDRWRPKFSTGPLDWAWRIETTFHRACTVGRVGGKDILPLSAPEISEDDEGKGVGDTHFQEDQRQDSGTLAPAESKEMHVELPIRFMTCSTSR